MGRITDGERLGDDDIGTLAGTPDILPLGMLADAMRRRLHGTDVTFVRVGCCPFAGPFVGAVPPAAREARITGTPDTTASALAAVAGARAAAGDQVVSGFSWTDIERLADGPGGRRSLLTGLRAAGLDALAELPLDRIDRLDEVVDLLTEAGFERLRLTVDSAPAAERVALFVRAAAMQGRAGVIQSINPLPMRIHSLRPTTGYDDVKMVAIARLALPLIPMVQVDWLRYGPKLAQVALTFGADDLDGCPAADEAPDGHRRAPLEEVRRNIEAAGFRAAERDGRFSVLA